MARFLFNEIFSENPADNSLTPIRTIRIGSATFGSSVTFRQGVYFGGVNVFEFKGKDIEADEEGDVLVIKGFYQKL